MKQHRVALTLVALAISLSLAYGVLYWRGHDGHEVTDNAYVRAHSVMVTSRIEGQIDGVLVDDNERVTAGQVLATLDERDYRAELHEAEAALAAARASVLDLEARLDRQSDIIQQAQAEVEATQASLDFARNDASRYRNLSHRGAASRQALEKAQEEQGIWEARLVQDQAAKLSAEKEVDVLQAQLVEAEASIEQSEARLEQARLNISYATIRAPSEGVVTQRTARVGAYIQPGSTLMAIVPTQDAFVVANFLETQLGEMAVGQGVQMTVDGLPGTSFEGHVDSIAPASGASFSGLAAENATGNFTKITQRIPVKIVFEPGQDGLDRIRIGMSVIASVDTRSS
ncbi:HlyD family secretion protein [Halomonas litopenaei]|uniref:HlyD family secretion protein n=1 Tax=Halomonas litopenaei TaxID=2109328 RepID=UPI003F9FEDC7